MTAATSTDTPSKPKHTNGQHAGEKECEASPSPIEIVMSSRTTNPKNQPTKPAPGATLTTEREELNHALELEEEWADEHGARVLPEDVRPLQPATHSIHRNAHQLHAERKVVFDTPDYGPAMRSFNTFVDHLIERSEVQRWSLRVDKVPIRADAHAALLERLKLLQFIYYPMLHFVGGSNLDWSFAHDLRDSAITCPQLAPERLLPLDWFLDEEDAQVWREKTQQEKLHGLPQRLGLVHTAKAMWEEQKVLATCFLARGSGIDRAFQQKAKELETGYQEAKAAQEDGMEASLCENEWVQWMYNGTHGTKKERKEQHKQHTKQTGPTTLKPVDARLRTCRKALMCADLHCWSPGHRPWYTPGGGEPVVTPPQYAQQVQDAKDKQNVHHSGFKDHHVSLPKTVADWRSMKNTYDFVIPLCVISIPDDFETQRLNLQREWYPDRIGLPGASKLSVTERTKTKPPTVFCKTPESTPDNAHVEAESLDSHQSQDAGQHGTEAGHKKDKHTEKKKTQARQWARDAKTGL
eukprot:TRINITY_DN67602_c10_g2_i2.p1 TRINITY_DN67602_c10_g2~~TRINITY_DN67602_c10_g2_i2.p1  ORF type:complete len:604 (-),score=45.32 TRINITY_DN67602_c10_g2_i2:69-1637(-)